MSAVGLVLANMIMGAESFFFAEQTSFHSNITSPSWERGDPLGNFPILFQIDGLVYPVIGGYCQKKVLSWDDEAMRMAETQERFGTGPSQGSGTFSADEVADMREYRDHMS
jgi:hypothetical protein